MALRDWLPCDPLTGPPLPKWLGLTWPWLKPSLPTTQEIPLIAGWNTVTLTVTPPRQPAVTGTTANYEYAKLYFPNATQARWWDPVGKSYIPVGFDWSNFWSESYRNTPTVWFEAGKTYNIYNGVAETVILRQQP